MAGARHGTGPALIKPTARFFGVLLLIVAFAATPFFWLIARDMVSVSFVHDKQVAEQRQRLIFAGLVDEVQRRRDIDHMPSRKMASIVLSYPSCETVLGGEIRIDHRTAQTNRDPIYRNPAEVLEFFRTVAPNRLTMRGYEISETSRAFGNLEASALRACIAATPFQGGCIGYYEKTTAARGSRFEDGLIALGFLKVVDGATAGPRDYCYSLPKVEVVGEHP
jgi:hypothetical protein